MIIRDCIVQSLTVTRSLAQRHPLIVRAAAAGVIVMPLIAALVLWLEGARAMQGCTECARRLLALERAVSQVRRMAFDGHVGSDTRALRCGLTCILLAGQARLAAASREARSRAAAIILERSDLNLFSVIDLSAHSNSALLQKSAERGSGSELTDPPALACLCIGGV